MKTVPASLRTWFVIHSIVDLLVGLPLLFFRGFTVSLFGLLPGDLLTPRLVAAALIGIGGISFLARNETGKMYQMLLRLKLLWSGSAILAVLLSFTENVSWGSGIILGIFLFFFVVWGYYWNILRRK